MKAWFDGAVLADRVNLLGFYVDWADWHLREVKFGVDFIIWCRELVIRFTDK